MQHATEAERELARLIVQVLRLRRAAPPEDRDPAWRQPPGAAAAWEGIAVACELIADHARFLGASAPITGSPRNPR